MARKGSILHRMFAAFAKDAEPEEVREAARAVDEAEGGDPAETQQSTTDKDVQAIMDAMEALSAKVDAFQKQKAQDDDPDEEPGDETEKTEALDDLEEELEEGGGKPAETEDDESEEESVTVPPEQLEEDEDPEDVPADEKKPVAAADRALALSVIRTMRPFIAAMPPRQQRRASDALSRTLKKAMRSPGDTAFSRVGKQRMLRRGRKRCVPTARIAVSATRTARRRRSNYAGNYNRNQHDIRVSGAGVPPGR